MVHSSADLAQADFIQCIYLFNMYIYSCKPFERSSRQKTVQPFVFTTLTPFVQQSMMFSLLLQTTEMIGRRVSFVIPDDYLMENPAVYTSAYAPRDIIKVGVVSSGS